MHLLLQLVGLALRLGRQFGVRPLLGEVDHHLQVLEPALVALQLLDGGAQLGDLTGDPLRVLLVVPEIRRGELVLQRCNLLEPPVDVKETS